MNVNHLPNFLLIGAAKSGTTTLYNYLVQHPQVFMPEFKEPRFFIYEGQDINRDDPINRKTITDYIEYQKLFDKVTNELAIGEASGYLPSKDAVLRIKKYLPEVRLVAILRNPIDRAFSHYTFSILKGFENERSFDEVVTKDIEQIDDLRYERNYLRHGLYYQHLSRYYEQFDTDKIKIFLYEDLVQEPGKVAQELYEFLGVDSSFTPNHNIGKNKSGKVKSKIINKIYRDNFPFRKQLKSIIPLQIKQRVFDWIEKKNIEKVEFPQSTRPVLQKFYKADILKLQGLVKKDLSNWLQ